jgi:hypothetical protein
VTTGVRSGQIGHCFGSLIIELSAYKHGTNIGTPESHERNDETQICSVASQMDAHHKRTIATMDAWLEDMRAWRKELKAD